MEDSHTSDAFEYFFRNGYRCRYETPGEEKTRKEGRPASWLQEGYTLKTISSSLKFLPEDNPFGRSRRMTSQGWVKNVPQRKLDECFDVVDLIQTN